MFDVSGASYVLIMVSIPTLLCVAIIKALECYDTLRERWRFWRLEQWEVPAPSSNVRSWEVGEEPEPGDARVYRIYDWQVDGEAVMGGDN